MFDIEIISVEGIIFQGQAHQAVVPTLSGEIGFMKDHESVLSELKSGKILILDESNKLIKEIEVQNGTAEMFNGEKLTILVD